MNSSKGIFHDISQMFAGIDQKTVHPGVFGRFRDVSNFLLHTFALLLNLVTCLYEKTFPQLALEPVFSLSVDCL